MEYTDFLTQKRIHSIPSGFPIRQDRLHSALFDWQRQIVQWALARGKAAIFAGCGLGKTVMQLEWAQQVHTHTGRPVLLFAPLAVAQQTVREGAKFGYDVRYCLDGQAIHAGLNITNYERIEAFHADDYGAIVADESSILKGFDGVRRKQITDFAHQIQYRLACTATPAPNDTVELLNHAEFLSVMTGKEMKAVFFVQDGNTTHAWRLRRHAVADFWRFLASWAVAVRRPSDLGYADGDFVLPPLQVHEHPVEVDTTDLSTLIPMNALTIQERQQAKRDSIDARVEAAAAMVNESTESWAVWCHLNKESTALAKAIPGAVEVKGSDSQAWKEQALIGFADGTYRVLITKPSIAGHGLNLQICHNVCFVGLNDSWEQYYQAVRRCWRFGQSHPVDVHIVCASTEGDVWRNIQRKEAEASIMMEAIVKHMGGLHMGQSTRDEAPYAEDIWTGDGWTIRQGDSVHLIDLVDDDAVGLTVTSVPFPGMYTYSNTPRDMGNVKDIAQMIEQLRYLMGEDKLYRATMPGRSCCIHLTQSIAFKGTDGYIGIKDFRGDVIRMMESEGWIYYGEVAIDKDPQLKAIRTKDRGLLFKTLAKNAEHMHMALADYLLQFRKPGDSPEPVRAGISSRYHNEDGWITPEEWIEWAAPVWYKQTKNYPGGIRETDVLNVLEAREADDERHLCPLQLGVCERAIKLWSAPGELVCDPFAGIGSVGYEALRHNRAFLGFELKQSYAETAVKNMQRGIRSRSQQSFAL